jgi:hypothetical protein
MFLLQPALVASRFGDPNVTWRLIDFSFFKSLARDCLSALAASWAFSRVSSIDSASVISSGSSGEVTM